MSGVMTGRGTYVIAQCRNCDFEREATNDGSGTEAVRLKARRHADRLGHTVDVDRTVFTTYAPSPRGGEGR